MNESIGWNWILTQTEICTPLVVCKNLVNRDQFLVMDIEVVSHEKEIRKCGAWHPFG
jgi:hypothetical protein